MRNLFLRPRLTTLLLLTSAFAAIVAAQTTTSLKGLMYVGTLDHKLLIITEDKGDIVGEIPLDGIPRTTVLSADKTKLHIVTTQMQVETVDLAARKVVSSFPLSDGKSSPRMARGAGGRSFSGIAVDPSGRYLYMTVSLTVKEIDQYRTDPPQWITVDLQDKKIAKSTPFPKGYDHVFDLATLKGIDRIALAKPEYPGASPYRLQASDDPNVAPDVVTSVFTSVGP